MSNTEALKEIEASIEQASKLVEFGSAIERLATNRDFKTVISKGYFELEAIRLVHLKADVNMQSADAQASILRQMDAIGSLNDYLQTKLQLAGMAKRSISVNEEALEEMLIEELA